MVKNLEMILAMTVDGIIGKDNDLPWPKLNNDMKWFVEKTRGKTVLMGSKTWESLPNRPLPNRKNIVLSRTSVFHGASLTTSGEPEEVLSLLDTNEPIVVIGGKEIFEQYIDYTSRVFLTIVNGEYDGDTVINKDALLSGFELVESVDDGILTFQTWEKVYETS